LRSSRGGFAGNSDRREWYYKLPGGLIIQWGSASIAARRIDYCVSCRLPNGLRCGGPVIWTRDSPRCLGPRRCRFAYDDKFRLANGASAAHTLVGSRSPLTAPFAPYGITLHQRTRTHRFHYFRRFVTRTHRVAFKPNIEHWNMSFHALLRANLAYRAFPGSFIWIVAG